HFVERITQFLQNWLPFTVSVHFYSNSMKLKPKNLYDSRKIFFRQTNTYYP
uniref:Uncharacterized protein n=1 Tax=Aegilops tauschii subsp. strangulata TaxID=200361 RepID=A0A453FV82_AEGTS